MQIGLKRTEMQQDLVIFTTIFLFFLLSSLDIHQVKGKTKLDLFACTKVHIEWLSDWLVDWLID